MPAGYQIFENFEKEKYVSYEELKNMVNYIGATFNSDYYLTTKIDITNILILLKLISFSNSNERGVLHPTLNGEKPSVMANL